MAKGTFIQLTHINLVSSSQAPVLSNCCLRQARPMIRANIKIIKKDTTMFDCHSLKRFMAGVRLVAGNRLFKSTGLNQISPPGIYPGSVIWQPVSHR